MDGNTKVENAEETLTGQMAAQNLSPLWEIYQNLVVPEPFRAEPSVMWRWADMAAPVERAGREVTGEDANHRVLLFKNPHFDSRMSTTQTLIAGVQCVMPGEKTVPHRHTPSAFRLILEGKGGGTFVDGVRCDMHDGDVILTPNWTWHGHDNDSDERTVWMDILDVPLTMQFDAVFGEGGPPDSYPENAATQPDESFAGGLVPETDRPQAALGYSPKFRYPWSDVTAALDATAPRSDGTKRIRYTSPRDGGPVMANIDAYALEIPDGGTSADQRTTANALYVVVEGAGRSTIGDVTHDWQAGDTFTAPHWTWAQHHAMGGKARLVVVSDREVLRRMDFLREETR